MGMHWNGGWYMGGMWIWWLTAILLLFLIAWLLARGVLAGRSPQPPAPPRESPEDVLKRRLASGEIDRDEYEETLRELRK
jgi:putative membrane protein